MKRVLPTLFLLLLFAPLVEASNPLTQGIATWTESQLLTRAAPATGSAEGIALVHAVAFRLVICAPSGQAITGGTVVFWVQTQDGLWADNPTLKQTLQSTGQRCQVVGGDWKVLAHSGRFLPANSAVTLSGAGTATTMKLEVQSL